MEPNSSRKSWLSLVRITISLFTKPLTGIGGCSSRADREKERKREGRRMGEGGERDGGGGGKTEERRGGEGEKGRKTEERRGGEGENGGRREVRRGKRERSDES